jgi:mRNA interferase HigB
MRIIARRTLLRFVGQLAGHQDQRSVKNALDACFDEVRKATWTSASDVKKLYATASLISAERIVFNIKGNDYRLVVAVDYQKGIVWIKWLGTHADYDRIEVAKVKYEP